MSSVVAITPVQFAKLYPSASVTQNAIALRERVINRIDDAKAITPPQYAALIAAWRLA